MANGYIESVGDVVKMKPSEALDHALQQVEYRDGRVSVDVTAWNYVVALAGQAVRAAPEPALNVERPVDGTLREAVKAWMTERSDHVHPVTPAEERLMLLAAVPEPEAATVPCANCTHRRHKHAHTGAPCYEGSSFTALGCYCPGFVAATEAPGLREALRTCLEDLETYEEAAGRDPMALRSYRDGSRVLAAVPEPALSVVELVSSAQALLNRASELTGEAPRDLLRTGEYEAITWSSLADTDVLLAAEAKRAARDADPV